ncbi:MAG: ArnT family glycosyltransferase [Kofleriaceae bacterium]
MTARLVRFATKHALVLIAVLFTAVSVARIVATAKSQGWTYDERLHLDWSERFLEGVSERWSNPGYDSKTPISVPNALFERLAGSDSEMRRVLSRLPMVAWFLALVAGTFLLARRMGRREAGPLAVVLLCLEPNIIAHSTVVTVDVPLAACTLWSVLAFQRFCEQVSPTRGLWAGAALGATLVAKFSAVLVAAPLFVAAAVAVYVQRESVPLRRGIGSLLLCGVAALLVIAVFFGFEGMFTPLADIRFVSRPFVSLTRSVPWLPLPLPEAFLTGLDMCIAREREAVWNVVVLGQHHTDGVWYYFFLHYLIKTPLGLVALTLAALGVATWRRMWTRSHLLVAVTIAIPLAYFSFIFRDQVGYRFTLLCVPLALVLVADVLARVARTRVMACVIGVFVVLGVVENVRYWTNPLSFTNSLIIHKERAYDWVADSNLDWGQHDETIASQVREGVLPAERVNPPHPLVGRNIFAVNTVAGVWSYEQFESYRWLRETIPPTEHIDDTHLVFDVDAAQFDRMLVETRTLEAQRWSCAVTSPIAEPILLRQTNAVVCVEAFEPTVIRLLATRTNTSGPGLALRSKRPRDVRVRANERLTFETMSTSQELWYRLMPGFHILHLTGTGNVTVHVERGRAKVIAGEALAGTEPPNPMKRGHAKRRPSATNPMFFGPR